MRPTSLFLLACLNVACISASAGTSGCAATVQELARMTGEPAFPLKWTETTMGDGKPLLVSISERQGVLALEFTKTREGLWAESTGVICPSGVEPADDHGDDRLADELRQLAVLAGGELAHAPIAGSRGDLPDIKTGSGPAQDRNGRLERSLRADEIGCHATATCACHARAWNAISRDPRPQT